jgi:hypothetical protein
MRGERVPPESKSRDPLRQLIDRMTVGRERLGTLVTESKLAERPASSSGVRAIRLLDDPYLVAVPVDWPAESTVESLLDRPWIDGPPDTSVRPCWITSRPATA